MHGLLVAIEGIDGSGKSTLARDLCTRLVGEGHPIELTGEPTTFRTGQVLRERLAGDRPGGLVDAAIDAEYFLADRVLHNHVLIKPALAAGKHVISDRYDIGTLAYQSTQGLPLDYLLMKRSWMLRLGLVERPALHLLVDTRPENAMARLRETGKKLEKFEGIEFLTALRRTYLALPQRLDDCIEVVNGDRPRDEVLSQAAGIVTPLLRGETPPKKLNV